MADENQHENGADGGEDDSPEALRRQMAEMKKTLGTLMNEKKRTSAERDKLVEQLKAWNSIGDEHGVDPESLKGLLSQRDRNDLERARETGEVDKLLANQRAKLEKEMAPLREQVEAKSKVIEQLLIDERLRAALDQIKVKKGLKNGAFAVHRPKCTLVQDPDVPYGLRAVVPVGDDVMDLVEHVKRWAETDPEAEEYLEEPQGTGGGANAGTHRSFVKTQPRSKMSAKDKSDYIRARGIEEYQKLPWA